MKRKYIMPQDVWGSDSILEWTDALTRLQLMKLRSPSAFFSSPQRPRERSLKTLRRSLCWRSMFPNRVSWASM